MKTEREKRYCRCLMKVRSKLKRGSPYAICTNSVYSIQGTKRRKVVKCSEKYDFKKYTMKQLRAYAKEKKIPHSNMNKSNLIKKLDKYAKSKKSKKIRRKRKQTK